MAEEGVRVIYSGAFPATIEGIYWQPNEVKTLPADVAYAIVGRNQLRIRLSSLTGPCTTCGQRRREGEKP